MAEHLVPINAHGGTVVVEFIADGSAVDLVFGYVPDWAIVVNENAATGETSTALWTHGMGDAHAVNFRIIADNGSTGNTTPAYVSSGGAVSEKETGLTVQTTNPVKVYADMGLTIAAAFMDDSDVIHVIAGKGDYYNVGDVGA